LLSRRETAFLFVSLCIAVLAIIGSFVYPGFFGPIAPSCSFSVSLGNDSGGSVLFCAERVLLNGPNPYSGCVDGYRNGSATNSYFRGVAFSLHSSEICAPFSNYHINATVFELSGRLSHAELGLPLGSNVTVNWTTPDDAAGLQWMVTPGVLRVPQPILLLVRK